MNELTELLKNALRFPDERQSNTKQWLLSLNMTAHKLSLKENATLTIGLVYNCIVFLHRNKQKRMPY